MKVFGLVQARMGSSRLPGKVMRPLAGEPLIWHIVDRLKRVPGLQGNVLATTADPSNDELESFAGAQNLPVVRWPDEDDIIGRLLAAADLTGADAFVKVNADCPLLDPVIVADLLAVFLSGDRIDLATNKLDGSFPLGYSVEIVRIETLRRCDRELRSPAQRELVIQWMIDHPESFRLLGLSGPNIPVPHDLTVDYPDDYALMQRIFDALYSPGTAFGLDAVLRVLQDFDDVTIPGSSGTQDPDA